MNLDVEKMNVIVGELINSELNVRMKELNAVSMFSMSRGLAKISVSST